MGSAVILEEREGKTYLKHDDFVQPYSRSIVAEDNEKEDD
jgi:hypothetical protein